MVSVGWLSTYAYSLEKQHGSMNTRVYLAVLDSSTTEIWTKVGNLRTLERLTNYMKSNVMINLPFYSEK